MRTNDFFKFRFFNELNVGDVFKFSPIIDNDDLPSRFYTVYYKDELITKINSSYGKKIISRAFQNQESENREVMVFPERNRNHETTASG